MGRVTATEGTHMAIEPKVPHDDLIVTHAVIEEFHPDYKGPLEGYTPLYLATLQQPPTEDTPLRELAYIAFHKGSPVEGWRGWTTAKVIEALIMHMEFFQTTFFGKDPNARAQNELILKHLHAALDATKARVDDRKERGVLYDTEKV